MAHKSTFRTIKKIPYILKLKIYRIFITYMLNIWLSSVITERMQNCFCFYLIKDSHLFVYHRNTNHHNSIKLSELKNNFGNNTCILYLVDSYLFGYEFNLTPSIDTARRVWSYLTFRDTDGGATDLCYDHSWARLYHQLDCLLCYSSFVRVCLMSESCFCSGIRERFRFALLVILLIKQYCQHTASGFLV